MTTITLWGIPFQKTMESVPKLTPLTVMVNGTLPTGTLLGDSSVIEGGKNPVVNFALGSWFPEPAPQPILTRTASRRLVNRISPTLPVGIVEKLHVTCRAGKGTHD